MYIYAKNSMVARQSVNLYLCHGNTLSEVHEQIATLLHITVDYLDGAELTYVGITHFHS